jgi:predicted nucleotidyltransferase
VIQTFLDQITEWALSCPDIIGVALVGAFARGDQNPSSDIDVMLLVDNPQIFLKNTNWAENFGTVDRSEIEDWGKVTSLRVWYGNFKEVEYGFTTPDWANVPVDPGTARVVSDGLRILYDPTNLLNKLMAEIN